MKPILEYLYDKKGSIKSSQESYDIEDAKQFIKIYDRGVVDYDDAFNNAEDLLNGLSKSSHLNIRTLAQNAIHKIDGMDDFVEMGEFMIETIRKISKLKK